VLGSFDLDQHALSRSGATALSWPSKLWVKVKNPAHPAYRRVQTGKGN
jgi:hypothetical protein